MSRKKQQPTREFLSPADFAAALDVCEETIYRLVSRGRLDAVRVGRVLRLPTSQLDGIRTNDNANGDS